MTPTKHSAASPGSAQRVYMARRRRYEDIYIYMSLVTRSIDSSPVQCCWSDFAEHSSTVPHSTCACIHVDLHVCSPCQSRPHSARLSAPSARFCSVSENARFCSKFCRHYPPTPKRMPRSDRNWRLWKASSRSMHAFVAPHVQQL